MKPFLLTLVCAGAVSLSPLYATADEGKSSSSAFPPFLHWRHLEGLVDALMESPGSVFRPWCAEQGGRFYDRTLEPVVPVSWAIDPVYGCWIPGPQAPKARAASKGMDAPPWEALEDELVVVVQADGDDGRIYRVTWSDGRSQSTEGYRTHAFLRELLQAGWVMKVPSGLRPDYDLTRGHDTLVFETARHMTEVRIRRRLLQEVERPSD